MSAFDPITGAENLIGKIGGDLISRLLPDPTAQAQAKQQLVQLQQNGELSVLRDEVTTQLAQIQVNKAEAEKPGLFSDWRDFIGWVCGLAFFWQYVGLPFASFWLEVAHYTAPVLPHLDMSRISQIMIGMLGLGAGTLKMVERRIAPK